MRALLEVILQILDLYIYVIIGSAILSWLIAFNVVNMYNDIVRSIWKLLTALTEPVLRPIRNLRLIGAGSGLDRPWRHRGDGALLLNVRLTPKSARDELDGVGLQADGKCYLKARVRAVPQDGEANAALVRLVAKTLGLPAASVEVASGATSRLKTLALTGDAGALETALARLCGD
jgi:uncharacterized protein YggU (UPF0235/DUF167 family)/uncharacterized protein YggT (Ycf19 family)